MDHMDGGNGRHVAGKASWLKQQSLIFILPVFFSVQSATVIDSTSEEMTRMKRFLSAAAVAAVMATSTA
ncbi:MAG: hypothetical protein PVF23_01575, partial [Chromatiales bacterium]